jgi:hypothetical protein
MSAWRAARETQLQLPDEQPEGLLLVLLFLLVSSSRLRSSQLASRRSERTCAYCGSPARQSWRRRSARCACAPASCE